jgi:hypothetical protein
MKRERRDTTGAMAALEEALRRAENEAEDAASAARSASSSVEDARRALEDLEAEHRTGGLVLSEDRTTKNVNELIAICRELAAPLAVWDDSFASDNLERLVELMREYTRKAVAA